jgi:hypothetical protein
MSSDKSFFSIQVSHGELLDRLSILQIKNQRIQSPEKLVNVRKELDLLQGQAETLLTNKKILEAYVSLKRTNGILWDIEDRIRLKEKNSNFDSEFVELARSVYFQNDARGRIKRHINEISGSELIEEKEYQDYELPKNPDLGYIEQKEAWKTTGPQRMK